MKIHDVLIRFILNHSNKCSVPLNSGLYLLKYSWKIYELKKDRNEQDHEENI